MTLHNVLRLPDSLGRLIGDARRISRLGDGGIGEKGAAGAGCRDDTSLVLSPAYGLQQRGSTKQACQLSMSSAKDQNSRCLGHESDGMLVVGL
jgi:hypothetical protein